MQIIKSLFKLVFFLSPFFAGAQSTYFSQGDKAYQLLDRLEIKQQSNSDLNFSTLKPFSRKFAVQQADTLLAAPQKLTSLTPIDKYNLNCLLINNSEWAKDTSGSFLSRKPILKYFYQSKTDLFRVNNKDLFLAINPVLQFQLGSADKMFFNSRGIMARGMIAKKLGFVTLITDNQERGPLFVQQKFASLRAVPGAGFYKSFKTTGVDYFDARGYITFSAVKNYIDVQFGYDKNFIGNGYRSLFLSDWGNSYLFLKLNTRIWKFNYQNLFMELTPTFYKNSGDILLDKKYAAMHHLSMNVTKWLNLGLFEGVIFGRKNNFDFEYLNPIIFLRHIEGTLGSPDNAIAGLDFKANIAHRVQFYGQFLLDEFKLDKLRENNGWWGNKWGLQTGIKYIDALGIRNLDLQLESNRVRPFTYSHGDSLANYTHYNLPLAHPLGANFQEFVGIAKYQPAPRWYISAKLIYYKQGLDSTGYNSGSSIFRSNADHSEITDYNIGNGQKVNCLNGTLQISYELRENLFLDLSIQHRNLDAVNNTSLSNKATFFSGGIRLNVFKREYDF